MSLFSLLGMLCAAGRRADQAAHRAHMCMVLVLTTATYRIGSQRNMPTINYLTPMDQHVLRRVASVGHGRTGRPPRAPRTAALLRRAAPACCSLRASRAGARRVFLRAQVLLNASVVLLAAILTRVQQLLGEVFREVPELFPGHNSGGYEVADMWTVDSRFVDCR